MLGKLQHIALLLKTDYVLLRCLFGVSLSLVLATSLNLFTPQLSAVFTLMFLGKQTERLSLKKSVLILVLFGILGSIGNFFGKYLVDLPLVILPLLGVLIFWSYRLTQIPAPVRLLFLMFTILLSFVSVQGNFLGGFVLDLLLLHLGIALLVIQFSFLLFPTSPKTTTKQKKEQASLSHLNLDKLAFNGMLVVMPVVLVFFTFNLNVLPLTLVFIVILGFDPFIYRSKKGLAMIVGNVFGGLLGLLAYNILVIAPSYLLYILLIVSIGGYFVLQIFSDKKIAPIYDLAFKTFFVVMGTISVSDSTAGSAISDRLLQIGLAIVYVVVAFKVVNTFNNPKISKKSA